MATRLRVMQQMGGFSMDAILQRLAAKADGNVLALFQSGPANHGIGGLDFGAGGGYGDTGLRLAGHTTRPTDRPALRHQNNLG